MSAQQAGGLVAEFPDVGRGQMARKHGDSGRIEVASQTDIQKPEGLW
jgi:hypothetical protein